MSKKQQSKGRLSQIVRGLANGDLERGGGSLSPNSARSLVNAFRQPLGLPLLQAGKNVTNAQPNLKSAIDACMDMDHMEEDDEDVVHLFKAKVVNVSILATLLKAVSFTDKVNVRITSSGMRFTVEEGKYVQASAFLRSDSFEEFTLSDSSAEIDFRIPLKELIGFLRMFSHGPSEGRFGSAATTMHNDNNNQPVQLPVPLSPSPQATLCLRYQCHGAPFTLVLDEGPTTTDFYLKTEEVQEDDLMELDVDPVSCVLMFKSEPLRDLFSEIESNAPEFLLIEVEPRTNVTFSGQGLCGFMKVSLPENCQIIEGYDCDELTKASYRFSVFRYSFKAMHLSSKVQLKIGAEGLLCMQFLMSAGTESYVEFYCLPSLEDEEIGD